MPAFEIVAHRGMPSVEAPENTIPAFQRAIAMGADAVELDVRLTSDGVPVVYHYFYLDEITSLSGPVFEFTFEQLQNSSPFRDDCLKIPTLTEILEIIGGKIGLEIELKGPEPEASVILAQVLDKFQHLWDTIEVTSFEPILLFDLRRRCPGIATDLLLPRSEDWMKRDVVAYLAIHRAKLAHARGVHLHPTQLSPEVVTAIRLQGIEVHSYDINDGQSLYVVESLEIPKICTDNLQQTIDFRQNISQVDIN